MPALRPRLLAPLAARGADGVEDVLELMDSYGMTKDDFDAIMELELLSGPNAKPAISSVATNAKSALTRKYNATHAKMAEPKKLSSSKGDEIHRGRRGRGGRRGRRGGRRRG